MEYDNISQRLEEATIKAENGSAILSEVANGGEGVYVETESTPTPTIKEFLALQENKINVGADSILASSEAARDRAENAATSTEEDLIQTGYLSQQTQANTDQVAKDKIEVQGNTEQVTSNAVQVAQDTLITVDAKNETLEARDLSRAWAVGLNPVDGTPSDTNNAAYHAAQALYNANRTFISGGVFTPSVGNEYPDVTGVVIDSVFFIQFNDPTEEYTVTTGQLVGEVYRSGFQLLYDTPNNLWYLIPTAVNGTVSVNNVPYDSNGNISLTASDFTDIYSINEADLQAVARGNNIRLDQVAILQTGTVSGVSYFYDLASEAVYFSWDGAITGSISVLTVTDENQAVLTVDSVDYELISIEWKNWRDVVDVRGWGGVFNDQSQITKDANKTAILAAFEYAKKIHADVYVQKGYFYLSPLSLDMANYKTKQGDISRCVGIRGDGRGHTILLMDESDEANTFITASTNITRMTLAGFSFEVDGYDKGGDAEAYGSIFTSFIDAPQSVYFASCQFIDIDVYRAHYVYRGHHWQCKFDGIVGRFCNVLFVWLEGTSSEINRVYANNCSRGHYWGVNYDWETKSKDSITGNDGISYSNMSNLAADGVLDSSYSIGVVRGIVVNGIGCEAQKATTGIFDVGAAGGGAAGLGSITISGLTAYSGASPVGSLFNFTSNLNASVVLRDSSVYSDSFNFRYVDPTSVGKGVVFSFDNVRCNRSAINKEELNGNYGLFLNGVMMSPKINWSLLSLTSPTLMTETGGSDASNMFEIQGSHILRPDHEIRIPLANYVPYQVSWDIGITTISGSWVNAGKMIASRLIGSITGNGYQQGDLKNTILGDLTGITVTERASTDAQSKATSGKELVIALSDTESHPTVVKGLWTLIESSSTNLGFYIVQSLDK